MAVTPDESCAVSVSPDGTLVAWRFIWDLEFPDQGAPNTTTEAPPQAVSPQKSHRLSLSQAAPNLKKALVGLGWTLQIGDGVKYDVDSSAFLCASGMALMFRGRQVRPPAFLPPFPPMHERFLSPARIGLELLRLLEALAQPATTPTALEVALFRVRRFPAIAMGQFPQPVEGQTLHHRHAAIQFLTGVFLPIDDHTFEIPIIHGSVLSGYSSPFGHLVRNILEASALRC
jgi:hypothetical protein